MNECLFIFFILWHFWETFEVWISFHHIRFSSYVYFFDVVFVLIWERKCQDLQIISPNTRRETVLFFTLSILIVSLHNNDELSATFHLWNKGPVIIYYQGGAGSNAFLRKIFSRPTRRLNNKIRCFLIFVRCLLFGPQNIFHAYPLSTPLPPAINNDRSLIANGSGSVHLKTSRKLEHLMWNDLNVYSNTIMPTN